MANSKIWRMGVATGLLVIMVGVGSMVIKNRQPVTDRAAKLIDPNTISSDPNEEMSSVCTRSSIIEYMSYPNDSSFTKPNNKFGLYIYAEEERFFKLADELVNSRGGDWGYVLIPYNVKDRDDSKWRRVFADLTKRHLIPIIQLWDINTTDYKNDTKKAAEFLNSFLWPVRERYISAYNEPNDARFWTNCDPRNYAQVLNYTIDTFKAVNANFFMLNGAVNSSAPDVPGYVSAPAFLYQMNQEVPGIFNKLDGWASHSYPQPNFCGSPQATGFFSIQAYAAELAYLKNTLGVTKELPVFITETGWAHAEGAAYNGSFFDAEKVAQNYQTAFETVWLKDERVRAVTPFTVYYKPPFDHFSWINEDGVPYRQFEVVKNIPKIKGEPASLQVTQMTVSACGE
ncbi:hypothetical protein KJ605_01535 [Patescibacteria group bacterium]|nr:hypothetical protein [Patescibacteria group bacterium]MBU1970438.1 hypothetical protein [Patescibacteria group bacterium]